MIDCDTEVLSLLLKVLGRSEKLLLKMKEKYQRLSEVNPYESRTLVYHHAKRLEKLGLIECVMISRAKFCKLTERGKKLKEMILERRRKAKERKEARKASSRLSNDQSPLDALEQQLVALRAYALFNSIYSKNKRWPLDSP